MKRERLLSRQSRRVLVVIAAISLLVLVIWGIVQNGPALGLISFVVYCAVITRLEAAVGRPFRRDAELDERQRTARDRAHRLGYLVMSIALLFALVPALLLDGTRWPTADGRTVPLVILGLIALVHPVVPWAILAWTEPDPIPLEEDARRAS